jgi:transposase
VPARAKVTTRAVSWATGILQMDDTTVAALARRLRVGWHTLWRAIAQHAGDGIDDPDRLGGVVTLDVDEHIWKPSRRGHDRAVTSMVDLTRDEHGRVRARLLDVVPGRSGTAYAAWLQQTPEGFVPAVEHAALDPFRGYANAIRGLLRHGAEHLSDRQHARLRAGFVAGDPNYEVEVAWHCYQQLRSVYHQNRAVDGRLIAEQVLDAFHSCPIPEIARLGRTLRNWRQQFLAYFDTGGVSNGGTEAINLIIEKTRRLAHGFRNFNNHRLPILLAASNHKPRRTSTTPAT